MTTRVYRYGLLAPTLGAELIVEQLSRAHAYQHRLVEIERARRARVAQILDGVPGVAEAQAQVEALTAEIDATVARIKAARAESRTRATSGEIRAAVKALRSRRREAVAILKAIRRAGVESLRPWLDAATTDAQQQVKAARRDCGLAWGTYLRVEQAVQAGSSGASPPAFRRWDGGGMISVQLQGGLGRGLYESGRDTRLQYLATPQSVPGRSGRAQPRVRLRVGSDGRAPVWAEWPVVVYRRGRAGRVRELPEDARIKWAEVACRRVAGQMRYELLLTVETETTHWRGETCGKGRIAVDLGWRKRDAGRVRAAYFVDDSGREGEIAIASVAESLRKCEELRSIRDQRLDEMRPLLTAAIKALGDAQEWLREATSTMHAWRSQARFAGLAIRWRGERFVGDDAAFALVEEWRQRDKHLWTWEVHNRRKALTRRLDGYRVFAASAARTHDLLVLEGFALQPVVRLPAPEDPGEASEPRAQRVMVAPSLLRRMLVEAFHARAGRVVLVDPAGTTQDCPDCGRDEPWDAAAELVHRCTGCGKVEDQDRRACRALLKRERSGGGTPVLPNQPREGRFQRAKRAREERLSQSRPEAEHDERLRGAP